MSGLPKVEYPEYKTTIQSTGEQIKFRPFTVAEEKILLTMAEGQDINEIMDAVKRLMKACTFGEVDIDAITSFDLEKLLLEIRSKSVSNTIEIAYKNNQCPMRAEEDDKTCKRNINLQINLDQVGLQRYDDDEKKWVDFDNKKAMSKKIQITDDVGALLEFPTMKAARKAEEFDNVTEAINYLSMHAIKSVWDADTVYDEFTEDDLIIFYENLPMNVKNEIVAFVNTMPVLRYEAEYSCSVKGCGFKDKFIFEGVSDFLA